MIVGSLGRIPVGALTDRYGARVMFPLVTVATIVPVLTLARARSYPALIVTASSSASAAPPSPSASRSSPAGTRRRGAASRIGVFGIGMGGTAIADFTTVRLADAYGERRPVPAGRGDPRACTRCCAFLLLRDAPGRPARPGRPGARLAATPG